MCLPTRRTFLFSRSHPAFKYVYGQCDSVDGATYVPQCQCSDNPADVGNRYGRCWMRTSLAHLHGTCFKIYIPTSHESLPPSKCDYGRQKQGFGNCQQHRASLLGALELQSGLSKNKNNNSLELFLQQNRRQRQSTVDSPLYMKASLTTSGA